MRFDDALSEGPSPVARRIGPVFSVEDLVSWLRRPLLDDATSVVRAAETRHLVAFRTTDRLWAFPEWSFERIDGYLELRADIAALWRELPHHGFLTDADLCAWMNTRFEGLDQKTPAGYVADNGIDDHVRTALRRLNTRVGRPNGEHV